MLKVYFLKAMFMSFLKIHAMTIMMDTSVEDDDDVRIQFSCTENTVVK